MRWFLCNCLTLLMPSELDVFMLILDIMWMKLKSLIFECINVANISFITVFMLLLDMMCNEIEVLIFGYGGYVFYTLLEQISIHYCSTFLYIVGAIYALLHNFVYCWSTLLCIVRTLCLGSGRHNSVHCSMHCLSWGRHNSGTIIP